MNFLKHKKTVNEIISLIDDLLVEQLTPKEQKQQDEINWVKDEIRKLRGRVTSFNSSYPYKKVEINFPGETKIKIRALSEEFNRTLVGDMFFGVQGGSQRNSYMDIRTRSFPDNLILRLFYKNLSRGTEQRGEAQLLYDRKGMFGSGPGVRKSDEVKLSFIIRQIR